LTLINASKTLGTIKLISALEMLCKHMRLLVV